MLISTPATFLLKNKWKNMNDYSGLSADTAVTAVTLEDLAPYALTTSGVKPAGVTGAGIVVEFDTDNTLRVTFKTDGSRVLLWGRPFYGIIGPVKLIATPKVYAFMFQ